MAVSARTGCNHRSRGSATSITCMSQHARCLTRTLRTPCTKRRRPSVSDMVSWCSLRTKPHCSGEPAHTTPRTRDWRAGSLAKIESASPTHGIHDEPCGHSGARARACCSRSASRSADAESRCPCVLMCCYRRGEHPMTPRVLYERCRVSVVKCWLPFKGHCSGPLNLSSRGVYLGQ